MFIEILNSLMRARHINKSVLARESGIPYTTIDAFYKKGCENIKLSTLQKLASYFGVSLDYLINGKIDAIPDTDGEWIAVYISSHEKAMLDSYRSNPDMSRAVDRILGVED